MIPTKENAHARLVEAFEKEIVTPMVDEMWELFHALMHVLTTHDLWSSEGTYTLPDGTTFTKPKEVE